MQINEVRDILKSYPYVKLGLREPKATTVLHTAVRNGSTAIVELLISSGADINVQDVRILYKLEIWEYTSSLC